MGCVSEKFFLKFDKIKCSAQPLKKIYNMYVWRKC